MRAYLFATLMTVASFSAKADSLDCNDSQPQPTEVSFYNNFGNVSFQLGTTHGNDFLYVIGNCDSEKQSGVGLPYTCQPAIGEPAIVDVRLLKIDNKPTANLKFHFEDGTSSEKMIVCIYSP